MDAKSIQKQLRGFGLYWGKIDGIIGSKSKESIRAFQRLNSLKVTGEADSKTVAELFPKHFGDRDANSVESSVDGFPRHQNVKQFYGKVGKNQSKVKLPYPMKLAWDTSKIVRRFSCHKLVVDPMQAIFEETLDHYGLDTIQELGLDQFGGCLNVRKMRGGSSYSMHSWGIAVDIDPVHNQLRWNNKKARLARPEYNVFWSIVEKHGAVSLGKKRNYDWMHFQFAKL